MNRKLTILFLACMIYAAYSYGQQPGQFWNESMQRIAQPASRSGWIKFKSENNIPATAVFTTHKAAFELGINDEMKLFRKETDDLGFTHYRYNQYYRGYRVIFAEYFVHEKNGVAGSANGKLVIALNKNSIISITKENALERAKRFLPSAKYAWEVPQLEQDKKLREHNQIATYYPAGELVWVPSRNFTGEMNPQVYELAYSFDIVTSGLQGKTIFVNASNGTVVNYFSLEYSCTGSLVNTNFNGSRQVLSMHDDIASTYLLWDDCPPSYVHTRRWQENLATADEYTSVSNNWQSVSSAGTSQWATRRAQQYFNEQHGRNGWNNANGGINIYQDALFCTAVGCTPTNPSNASFFNGILQVGNSGNGNTVDDWNSVDIIAHEFTHGVTSSSAGLIYAREPGALNESFSDIFGASCYAWFRPPDSNNWKCGFDRRNPSNTSQSFWIRNMANPNSINPNNLFGADPDTYLGTFWYNTNGPEGSDSWGVHNNSGVQNFMYYLLVTGGSGMNDNGTVYSVTGIGMDHAQKIAYRALTVYLGSNSQHADARNAWVQAASDIFGACSFQAIQTGKAWFAVGLGPPNIDQSVCGNYGASSFSGEASGSYFIAPNCNMTISNTGNLVQFGARSIIISPGFVSQNGSAFRAYLSECYFAAY